MHVAHVNLAPMTRHSHSANIVLITQKLNSCTEFYDIGEFGPKILLKAMTLCFQGV